MDCISPSQKLILYTIQYLECGHSLNMSLKKCLDKLDGDIRSELLQLIMSNEAGQPVSPKLPVFRKALYACLQEGLRGLPILDQLYALQEEAECLGQQDIEDFIAKTPLYSLLIVLFLFFPAYLLLILGPSLIYLNRLLGG